jgi:hypothetical protein
MRPVFADPKTGFVFKRIFGSEVHNPLLIELLNVLLELAGDHRIVDLKYLSDRWAYFFCEAEKLEMVPPALAQPPYREALEVARMAWLGGRRVAAL